VLKGAMVSVIIAYFGQPLPHRLHPGQHRQRVVCSAGIEPFHDLRHRRVIHLSKQNEGVSLG
jgi:hypothetical protein